MSIITGSFTASEQVSPTRTVTVGNRLIVALWGSWTGVVRVMVNGQQIAALSSNGNYQNTVSVPSHAYLHAAMVSTGTVNWRMEEANDFTALGNLEWDDLRFPAQGINPIGSVADPTVETDEAKFPGSLLFSASATNIVAGVAQMPHEWAQGTPIRPHIHWMKSAASSGVVLWHFYYRLCSRSGASPDWVGPIVGEDELGTTDTADREGITTFGSIDVDPTTSKCIAWRLYRIGGDAADTYAGTARLLEFDVHYQKDSLGSGAEFIK